MQSTYGNLHCENFVEAMKSNNPSILKTPIESGSAAAINAAMGNIAFRSGEKLHWDQANKRFKNSDRANALMQANYHNGWVKPKV